MKVSVGGKPPDPVGKNRDKIKQRSLWTLKSDEDEYLPTSAVRNKTNSKTKSNRIIVNSNSTIDKYTGKKVKTTLNEEIKQCHKKDNKY
jgi:hypothetical protein